MELLGDIYEHHISKHLSVCDKVNVINVNKLHKDVNKKLLSQQIYDTVIERLKAIFKNNYEEFKALMIKTNAVISGSFVLQCILGETWKSDIDIYIPTFDTIMLENRLGHVKTELEDFLYHHYTYYSYEDTSSYTTGSKIEWVRDYVILKPSEEFYTQNGESAQENLQHLQNNLKEQMFYSRANKDLEVTDLNGEKIINMFYIFDHEKIKIQNQIFGLQTVQTILVNCHKEELVPFICNYFDFDVCMNVFSFNQPVYIQCLYNIIDKKIKYKYTINEESSAKRRLKYENRGFTFI